eukprot:7092174-Karenia_brevis.AAC.1
MSVLEKRGLGNLKPEWPSKPEHPLRIYVKGDHGQRPKLICEYTSKDGWGIQEGNLRQKLPEMTAAKLKEELSQ